MLMPLGLFAQLFDDFSDGNITYNSPWQGNITHFKVNDQFQLQLNATGEGVSYLSAPLNNHACSEWRFWVKLGFSPSDNNQARLYLVSDNADLTTSLNGYYIKLGEAGSLDAIELYRQQNTVHTLVARCSDGFIATAFAVGIKVIRENDQWEIWADYLGGVNYTFQTSAVNNYWQNYAWLGVLCRYTSSNATKFWFDDIYAGTLNTDLTPPLCRLIEATGKLTLTLSFTEPISEASANQISNYYIDSEIGNPLAAGCDAQDKSMVHLLFDKAFISNQLYHIHLSGLADNAGNVMMDTLMPFTFTEITTWQVLIHEIMADPDPVVLLPNCEYIELHNPSPEQVVMRDWKLSINQTVKTLPEIIIDAGGYHMITGSGNETLLSSYGMVTGLSGLFLSNAGATVTLRNEQDAVIHSVQYNSSWYNSLIKENGGWSLEMIDPKNPCGGADNWKASIHPHGGTPGCINSVYSLNPDLTSPFITHIMVDGDSAIIVYFSESMDSLSLLTPSHYLVEPDLGEPISVKLCPPLYSSVILHFNHAIKSATTYKLSCIIAVSDCSGNLTDKAQTGYFALPSPAETNDVVINELLSEPVTGCSEFVELYNRSSKVINLEELYLSTRDATTDGLGTPHSISSDGLLFFPGEYLLLSKDPASVKANYYLTPNPHVFMAMNSFPILINSGGTIVVHTAEEIIIDEFTYNADMHFPLLNSTRGVSLERVDYNRPTNETGNWHSAAQSVGFATPGYCNSQFMQFTQGDNNKIALSSDTFSPDNDGYNDCVYINCTFTDPGCLITTNIYNSNGRFIKCIAANFLSGTSSVLSWDGTTAANEKAPVGIYVIYTQTVHLSGKTNHYRHAVVLAQRL